MPDCDEKILCDYNCQRLVFNTGFVLQIILVGIGGFFGAVARYGAMRWLHGYAPTFPLATLFVNVVGSFLLGLFATWIFQKTTIEEELRLAIQIGFLGALTTFSTFSLESLNLLYNGHLIKGMANIGLNLSLCLLAVWCGVLLARQLP